METTPTANNVANNETKTIKATAKTRKPRTTKSKKVAPVKEMVEAKQPSKSDHIQKHFRIVKDGGLPILIVRLLPISGAVSFNSLLKSIFQITPKT